MSKCRKKPPNPEGRPSKLTPELEAKILKVLAMGCFRETAAASVGICSATFRDWMRRGERYGTSLEKSGDRRYREFVDKVEEVEAQQEARDVAIVRKAGEDEFTDVQVELTHPDGTIERRTERKLVRAGDARHKEWILERRGSKRWGYKSSLKIELGPAVDKIMDAALKILTPEQYEQLLSAIATETERGDETG